jgi:prepilin-type N-terminal cleavage/methylation domain-containing protein
MNRRLLRHYSRGGFTLIEALVTLLLIGLVLPAIMHAITISLAAGSASITRNQAAELARSQLAQVILEMSQGQNAGDSAGDFSQQGFPNFRWQSSITPFSLDTSGMNMQEVHLTVTWPVRSHQESMMLSSLAYNHLSQTSQQ